MSESTVNVYNQIVQTLLFVHEDNREEIFEILCFTTTYLGMITYRNECKQLLRAGLKIDQKMIDRGWRNFEAELGEVLRLAGHTVFSVAKSDSYK